MVKRYDDQTPQYRDRDPQQTAELSQKFREERIKRICVQYSCSQEDAIRFIDLREEGYSVYEASVKAGLADPHF